MKFIYRLLFFSSFSFLWACEDPIQLTPKDNTPKYVIEGMITNEAGSCRVNISQTKSLAQGNQFDGVSGAIVKIEYNGSIVTLTETGKGIYKSNLVNGTPGETYKLNVNINGEIFTASSKMPAIVPFLDFKLKPSDYDTTRTTPMVKFKDPAGVTNYYWFQQYINDKLQSQYKVLNDEFTAGQEVNDYLVFENTTKNSSKNIMRGDKLTAEMHSIDAAVYTYLFSLANANGSLDGAAPANPQSNIKGGALGFFSAHTVERKSLIIP